MAPPLVLLQDIRFAIGTTALLQGATLSVSPGERLALVGRNGSGKATLLRIAAGALAPGGGGRSLHSPPCAARPPLGVAWRAPRPGGPQRLGEVHLAAHRRGLAGAGGRDPVPPARRHAARPPPGTGLWRGGR